MTHGCAVQVGTGRVVYRVVPGGWYTGYYPAGLHWYCQGPTTDQIRVHASTQALQALWALRTPGLLARALQASKGRDSGLNILKLVINPECHHI